jgi:hypothetical protein
VKWKKSQILNVVANENTYAQILFNQNSHKGEDQLMVLKNLNLMLSNENFKWGQLIAQLNSFLFSSYNKSTTSSENDAFAQFKGIHTSDSRFNFDLEINFYAYQTVLALNADHTKLKSCLTGHYNLLEVTRTIEYYYELDFKILCIGNLP